MPRKPPGGMHLVFRGVQLRLVCIVVFTNAVHKRKRQAISFKIVCLL